MPFRLVILTRDSATWILHFLAAYRKMGIEPLYIVDPRSSDETLECLKAAGASFVLFQPKGDFIEAGSLAFAGSQADRPWILRMDDDEFPAVALIQWAQTTACHSNHIIWGLPRLNAFMEDSVVKYNTGSYIDQRAEGRKVINPQFRLYRHDQVTYISDLHTPGFLLTERNFAPSEAYILHCDALLRGVEQRLNKVRRYEAIKPGFGWSYCDDYLPEFVAENKRQSEVLDAPEFAELLSLLPKAPVKTEIMMSYSDLRNMRIDRAEQDRHALRVSLHSRNDRAAKIVKRLPQFLINKRLAEAICTVASIFRPFGFTKGLQEFGSAIFERAAGLSE